MATTDNTMSKIITQSLVGERCLNLAGIYKVLQLDEQNEWHKSMIEKIIENLESSGKIVSTSLCGKLFYFENKKILQNFITKMENISKNSPKIVFEKAINEAEKIIKLPPNFLEAFLMASGSVGKYFFE